MAIVDSRNFPIATTIAAAIVTLEPGGLRELHWHPNVSILHPGCSSHGTLSVKPQRHEMLLIHLILKAEEWLYFHKGQARATVFLGGAIARTFDFTAGDTAVFPDNSGNSFFPSPCLSLHICSKLISPGRTLHREHFENRKADLD